MGSEQISQNKFIIQAVAKAARVAIQTMAAAGTSRQDNAGTKAHHEATYIQLECKRQM